MTAYFRTYAAGAFGGPFSGGWGRVAFHPYGGMVAGFASFCPIGAFTFGTRFVMGRVVTWFRASPFAARPWTFGAPMLPRFYGGSAVWGGGSAGAVGAATGGTGRRPAKKTEARGEANDDSWTARYRREHTTADRRREEERALAAAGAKAEAEAAAAAKSKLGAGKRAGKPGDKGKPAKSGAPKKPAPAVVDE